MTEIFVGIKGYENMYEISNIGRVKSLARFNSKKERFLKFDIDKKTYTEYFRVTLSKNNQTEKFIVHRLVAEAFIPNPENKPYVNHMDNDGTNNNVDNLEWVTHSENMIHAQKQGRLFNTQSKAGKIAATITRDKKLKELNNKIGNVFGEWTFIKPIPKNGNWYGEFKCSCGIIKEVNLSTILTGKSKQCHSCGLKQSHKNRKKIKI